MGPTAKAIRMRGFSKCISYIFLQIPSILGQNVYKVTLSKACLQNFDPGPTPGFMDLYVWVPRQKEFAWGGFSKCPSSYIFLYIPSILSQYAYQVTLSRACMQNFDLGPTSGFMEL